MSSYRTRIVARKCIEVLRAFNFVPKTVINVGVGSCPEFHIWRTHFPVTTCMVGIDPRGNSGRWTGDYVRAAVGAVSGQKTYCVRCRSTSCSQQGHQGRAVSVKCVTIDEVAAAYPPPYFMWMDIEGGEEDALCGATQTLQNTPWLNIEVQEFTYTQGHCERLCELLKSVNYVEHCKHEGSSDALYRRVQ